MSRTSSPPSCEAAVSDGNGGFAIKTLHFARPGTGEVLVEIRASGVCHTDYDHLKGFGSEVMGHEGAGVVVEVGADVELSPGDHVVLNWASPCGRCLQCSRGALHLCESKPVIPPGKVMCAGAPVGQSFGLGTMAELALVRREAVTRIPRSVPFNSACLLGCAVMTGFGSAVNAARIEPDATVAVIGVGGVGLNVIQGAAYRRARRIIAIDRHESRLAMAQDFGATDVVLAPDDTDKFPRVTAAVRALTNGRGADYAFECTAVPALGAAPLALVRNGGTAVAVSGIEQTISFDMELFEWDKLYINPLYGQCSPERDFRLLTTLYARGQLKLDQLVTTTYPLGQLDFAFRDMHEGHVAKAVIALS
jgi:S-(hydroxymethyl)glutathione dehydrogenase/alcohol dehydrogenase